jgi:Protein of unknown function (DUF1049).
MTNSKGTLTVEKPESSASARNIRGGTNVQRNAIIAVSAILLLATVVVAVQNGALVGLTLFGTALQAPLGALIAAFFVAGAIAPMALWTIRTSKEATADKTQLEWQKQDTKLIAEIESDKIKQLHAKIETLEAALDKALKKK